MSGLEWLSYQSAHSLIGLSPGIVRGIQKKRIFQNQIIIITNGCDQEFFDQPLTIETFRVEESDFMAIFCGAHGIANGLISVIYARELNKRIEMILN